MKDTKNSLRGRLSEKTKPSKFQRGPKACHNVHAFFQFYSQKEEEN